MDSIILFLHFLSNYFCLFFVWAIYSSFLADLDIHDPSHLDQSEN